MADVAHEYNILHLPDVTRNDWGTPLVSSIFELARQSTNSPLLAYVNADILLMPDFVKAALAKGHEIGRIFFYHDGVNNGTRYTPPPIALHPKA